MKDIFNYITTKGASNFLADFLFKCKEILLLREAMAQWDLNRTPVDLATVQPEEIFFRGRGYRTENHNNSESNAMPLTFQHF